MAKTVTEAPLEVQTPTEPSAQPIIVHDLPQAGGTYQRNADGSLTKIDEEVSK